MRASFGAALVLAGVAAALPRTPSPGVLRLAAERSPEAQQEIEGTWQGVLRPGPVELRVVFHVRRAEAGGYSATLDSPDQGVAGIPVSAVSLRGDSVRFEVAAVNGRFEGVLAATGQRIEGTWTQGPGSLPLLLERVAPEEAPRAAARPQLPRRPFQYREVEVRFPSPEAGIELAGTVTLPQGQGPFPGVVLLSGSGPQDRNETVAGHPSFLVLADHLTRHGVAVLRYDKRGVGRSQGDFGRATIPDFASDARGAVAYLKSLPEVDAAGVGVLGHSEGAILAAMIGAEAQVAFVVLLAPPALPGDSILTLQWAALLRAAGEPQTEVERAVAFNRRAYEIVLVERDSARAWERLRTLWREELARLPEDEKRRRGIRPENELRLFEAQLTPLLAPWVRSFLETDPRVWLQRLSLPTLALFGEKDLQVPALENAPALEAALSRPGNRDYTIRVLPGLNHLFQEAKTGHPSEYGRIEQTFAPSALELIAAWILERVR